MVGRVGGMVYFCARSLAAKSARDREGGSMGSEDSQFAERHDFSGRAAAKTYAENEKQR